MVSKKILPLLLIGLLMTCYAEASLFALVQCYASCGLSWVGCQSKTTSTSDEAPVCNSDFEDCITECLPIGNDHEYRHHRTHHHTSDTS